MINEPAFGVSSRDGLVARPREPLFSLIVSHVYFIEGGDLSVGFSAEGSDYKYSGVTADQSTDYLWRKISCHDKFRPPPPAGTAIPGSWIPVLDSFIHNWVCILPRNVKILKSWNRGILEGGISSPLQTRGGLEFVLFYGDSEPSLLLWGRSVLP